MGGWIHPKLQESKHFFLRGKQDFQLNLTLLSYVFCEWSQRKKLWFTSKQVPQLWWCNNVTIVVLEKQKERIVAGVR